MVVYLHQQGLHISIGQTQQVFEDEEVVLQHDHRLVINLIGGGQQAAQLPGRTDRAQNLARRLDAPFFAGASGFAQGFDKVAVRRRQSGAGAEGRSFQ